MKWLFMVVICLLLASVFFCQDFMPGGNLMSAGWAFSILFAMFIVMTLGFCTSSLLGRPLSVRQLEKRKLYVICGRGCFVANSVMKKEVYFVITGDDQVKAVTLPVDLPEKTTGFWVTNNYNSLGQRILGEGAILLLPSNDERIPFKWKEKSKDKK
jgi:hypothetical protein